MFDLWKDINDFSMYAKSISCIICGNPSFPTVAGGHFKCSKDGHIFNEDNSDIGFECECIICVPYKQNEVPNVKEERNTN